MSGPPFGVGLIPSSLDKSLPNSHLSFDPMTYSDPSDRYMPKTVLPDPDYNPALYRGVAGKRLAAWVLDLGISLGLSLVLLPFTLFIGLIFFPIFWLGVSFIYRWGTLSGGSATWGMRFMAIELRNADAQHLNGAEAFWHTAGYFASFTVPIAQVASVVLMLVSSRGQGLTDHVMGTAMLNRQARYR